MDYSKVQEYYEMAQNSSYLKNMYTGLVMSNKPLSSLAFNTGQMYNGSNNSISTPNLVQADGTKVQSHFANIKNQFEGNK